ncbi:MAG: chemotaxis protein CheC [Paludibaculum sp.]
MTLTELQTDVLKEVINIGVGYAASSLNDLVGTHVSLTVPDAALLTLEEAKVRIQMHGMASFSAVQMNFSGLLKGNVALLFPSDSAAKLVSLLTGEETGAGDLDGLRAATLEEAGNILLNGMVGSISNLIDGHLAFSIPHYTAEGELPNRLLALTGEDGSHVILARARFDVAQHQIEGEILLFLEIGSIEILMAALDRYVQQLI